MKKITALFMMIALVFSLAACGNTSSDKENSATDSASQGTSQASENNTSEPTDSTEPTNTTGGKTLVVYYSASGNTERVAKDIAGAVGADLFEIEPEQPYTEDDLNWTNSDSRVSREHDDESLRNVPLKTTEVTDWSSYDTVFIGYPNWWGDMPMILYSFFDEYDFSGKTIIPFNTHGGSGFSSTINTITELEPSATVNQNGFTVSRNDVQEAEPEILSWLREIGYK